MVSNDSNNLGLKRPLIGLPTYYGRGQYGVWDLDAAFLPSIYVTAVTRAGGRVVLLPPEQTWTEMETAELDGIVLTGGDDVNPALYGAEPHEYTQVPNTRRDNFEMALYRQARGRGVPILAICRGAQIVNTVHGGTLHQHMPELPGLDPHEAEAKDEFAEVTVTTVPGTAASEIIGPGTTVRCHHHQSINRIGEDLIISSWAADGTVESFEDSSTAVVAVQWHPEETLDDLRLFTHLVERARARARHRTTATDEETRL